MNGIRVNKVPKLLSDSTENYTYNLQEDYPLDSGVLLITPLYLTGVTINFHIRNTISQEWKKYLIIHIHMIADGIICYPVVLDIPTRKSV